MDAATDHGARAYQPDQKGKAMNYPKRRDLAGLIFWWFAVIFTIGFWYVLFLLFVWPALAHDAVPTAAQPNGWQYPVTCCSTLDCGEISASTVRVTPDGRYVVTIGPDDHKMLARETVFAFDITDNRVKPSPDGVYHICISRQFETPDKSATMGGNFLCFFEPARNF
jgi:hypothetical protein